MQVQLKKPISLNWAKKLISGDDATNAKFARDLGVTRMRVNYWPDIICPEKNSAMYSRIYQVYFERHGNHLPVEPT
jgi:hypothetical protein